LHNANANVTALSRTPEKLDELKSEFPRIQTLLVDLSDWDTTRKTLTAIQTPFDGIINNAATAVATGIMETTPEQLKM